MASTRIVGLSSFLLLALALYSVTANEDYQTKQIPQTRGVEKQSPNVGDEDYVNKRVPETSGVEEKNPKIGDEDYLTRRVPKPSVDEETIPKGGDEDYPTVRVPKTSGVEQKIPKTGDEDYLTKKVSKTSVVVEGKVYCQDCKQQGTLSLSDAKPISGAKISITCKNHRNRIFHYNTYVTNVYGYFYVELEGYTMGHYLLDHPLTACKVKLISSPQQNCNIPTNTNYGISGASLRYENKRLSRKDCDSVIYVSGPFAFRAAQCTPETRY